MNYEERIIAYIDILGFKKFIETTAQNGNQNNLYRILFNFKELADTHPLIRPDRESTHFSDLLVISIPIKKRAIIDLINDIHDLIHTFILSGLLLRGIILKGKILHQNGIIFGPGLINAFLIEKDKVKYPRIIVEKDIVEMFNLETDAVSNFLTFEGSRRLLNVDPYDHEFFINYLVKYIDNTKIKLPGKGIFNKLLQELTNEGLKNEDDRIRSKYQWIADWHNSYLTDQVLKIIEHYESDKNEGEYLEQILKSKFY